MSPALLSASLLHFVWEGVAIGALTELVLAGQTRARDRYVTACAGLATMAVAPGLTAAWLDLGPSTAGLSLTPVGFAVDVWVVRAWVAGVLLLSARAVADLLQIHALRSRAIAAPPVVLEEARRILQRWNSRVRVEIGVVARLAGPVAIGVFRPMVLLPSASLVGLSPDQLRAVLAHELAHVHRHDALANGLQVVVETLLFYHPVVWRLSSRVRAEREFCCDELAVDAAGDALVYARALSQLEAQRGRLFRLSNAATGGTMLNRIQRIVGATAPQTRPLWALPALGLALAAGFGSLAFADPAEPEAAQVWVQEDGEVVALDGKDFAIVSEDGVVRVGDGTNTLVFSAEGERLSDGDQVLLLQAGGDATWVDSSGQTTVIRVGEGGPNVVFIQDPEPEPVSKPARRRKGR